MMRRPANRLLRCRPRPGPAAAILLMSLAGAGGAAAAEGNWQSAEVAPGTIVEARLIAAVEGTGTLESIPAGLHVRLPEPWKTYWRSPGDAGLPPEADWSGSANVADAALSWPAPHRFTLFGIDTFGYADEVVFPLAATPARPGEPVALDARVDLLVCSDLCVPTTFDLDLALPAGPAAIDPDAANLIDRFRALVPGDGTAAGVTVEAVAAGEAGGGAGAAADRLSVAATARTPFADPDVFIEADGPWAFGAPEMTLSDDGRRLRADLPVLQAPPGAPPLAGLPVTVTLVDGPRAVEHTAVVGAPGDRADDPALGLLDADRLAQAVLLGQALRLANTLTGGASSLLERTELAVEDGEVVLSLPVDEVTLAGEAVQRRLDAVAKALDRTGRIVVARKPVPAAGAG